MIKPLFFLFTLQMILASCDHKSKHLPLQEKLKSMNADTIAYEASSADFLKEMNLLIAEVPSVEEKFYVRERSSQIQSFPCSSCHDKALDQLQQVRIKKAHWDIKLLHTQSDMMTCTTCHSDNNMDDLNSISGKKMSIDHSYKLCAQCHSTQYKDWQGGAHGKRLGGWTPPRVIYTCVDCHNPHKPSFETRWPARLNTVKLKEQQSE